MERSKGSNILWGVGTKVLDGTSRKEDLTALQLGGKGVKVFLKCQLAGKRGQVQVQVLWFF